MKVKVKLLSRVWLFGTPWTVAHQAPPYMGFSRQEYWSGLPFPSPGDLPDPGIEPRSPALEADALTSEPPVKVTSKWKQQKHCQKPLTFSMPNYKLKRIYLYILSFNKWLSTILFEARITSCPEASIIFSEELKCISSLFIPRYCFILILQVNFFFTYKFLLLKKNNKLTFN